MSRRYSAPHMSHDLDQASDNQGLPQVKVPQDLTLQPLPQGYWAALIALLCAHTGVWPLHARLTGTP